jgi:NADPH:quinone reductase-like Zn-dependent oxidoreductase
MPKRFDYAITPVVYSQSDRIKAILEEAQMKAIVHTKYGPPDVLQFKEVEKPTPKDGEILVKIHAASVNTLDLAIRGPFLARIITGGLRKPKDSRVGADIAGRVEAVGSNVTQFQPGDEVFGAWTGSFAEYASVPENRVALKPATSSFEEAAAIPVAAITALQGLRDKGQIQPGQKVLINGASGGVGTFAVQIAKAFGAEVTVVCSTRNVDMVRSIGADRVIDYTQADFTRRGDTYDMIFDVVGKSSFSRSVRLLTHNGRYLLGNSRLSQRVRGRWTSRRSSKKVILWAARSASEYAEDFRFLTELIEAGKIKSVIDRCYPLEQTAEAHRYVDTGQKKGNVVIMVEQNNHTAL